MTDVVEHGKLSLVVIKQQLMNATTLKTHLHDPIIKLFHSSSVVEQSAVNRSVVGSNPTCGAKWRRSSAGESVRFIPVKSWVRSPPPLPLLT